MPKPRSPLENPFKESRQRSGADEELVGVFLGEEEAEEMREAVGEGRGDRDETVGDISMSSEEKARAATAETEGEESIEQKRREEYIAWAIEAGFDENWVEKTFEFNFDGTVVCLGDLYLGSFPNLPGDKLPPNLVEVKGNLILTNLTSAEHLTLPVSVGENLDLSALTSAEHLTLSASVGGSLDLRDLTSAEHITFSDSLGGNLYLHALTSAEHLTLPDSIGGGLFLRDLTSAEHLVIPESFAGTVYVSRKYPAVAEAIRAVGKKVREI